MIFIFHSLFGFIGGLGIFLYGTHLLSDGLQRLAASKMREYLTKLTDTRMKGVLSGIVTTFFLQSSTVTSIMVLGLVDSAVLTLSQAFGVVLGSAIGTTLTVQILTFNISTYSSIFIFLGAIFIIFLNRIRWRITGLILLSIGFIFFGIHLISSSFAPLSKEQHFLNMLVSISKNPLLFTVLAMSLTALFHSSAAMIVIGITFVTTGVLSVQAVIPIVIGANIGSTIPVMVTSLATNKEGKKLALFNFLFKMTGAIIAFICLVWINKYLYLLPGSPERQIANFHMFFNIAVAIVFLPLLPFIAKGFERFFPKQKEEPTFTIKLNEGILAVPEEALIASKRQIVRLAEMVYYEMIQQLADFIEGNNLASTFRKVEESIDDSYIKIQHYLLKLGQLDLTSEQSFLEVKLLNILNEIEHIGDTIVRFIGVFEKVNQKNLNLDGKDLIQLKQLLREVDKTYRNSLISFRHENLSVAKENIQSQSFIDQFENDIKFNHYNSLINKKEYNPDISAVYLDIVNQLLQVNHHAMNISRTVLGLI